MTGKPGCQPEGHGAIEIASHRDGANLPTAGRQCICCDDAGAATAVTAGVTQRRTELEMINRESTVIMTEASVQSPAEVTVRVTSHGPRVPIYRVRLGCRRRRRRRSLVDYAEEPTVFVVLVSHNMLSRRAP